MMFSPRSPRTKRSRRRRYIARQPIVDAQQRISGYELLYRSARNRTPIHQHPNPSQDTLDCAVVIGFDRLCGARKAYLNCNRETLVSNDLRFLPNDRVVLEILEDVAPDPQVLASCSELRSLGFEMALDDFVPTPSARRFLEFVRTIKIDLRSTSRSDCRMMTAEFGPQFNMIAEKVESAEEFSLARESGFDLFQGFYLGHPELLWTHHVSAERLNHLRVLGSQLPFWGYEASDGR